MNPSPQPRQRIILHNLHPDRLPQLHSMGDSLLGLVDVASRP
jgi:hypothetical protein